MSTELQIPTRADNGLSSASRPFPRKTMHAGFAIVVAFCAVIGGWSYLAPIESAVVAPGFVSVVSNRRTVQHLEGGIVKQILVREGEQVRSDQILIQLEDAQHAALRNQLRSRLIEARAAEARLVAERDAAETVSFPRDLEAGSQDENVRSAIASQTNIFLSRRALAAEQSAVLGQRIASLKEEIAGLGGQIRASRHQEELIAEELDVVRKLVDDKLARLPRLLALKRSRAEIESEIAKNQAAIARAEQQIQEARLRIAQLRASIVAQVAEELSKVQAVVYETSQKLVAAENVVTRTAIRSPIDGAVVGLKVHTHGGVVAPGQALLDVIPVSDNLIVQASIDPRDIDEMQVGLPATVEIMSFNRRTRVPIDGKVQSVSADRLMDARTGQIYYLALIELSGESPGLLQVSLVPGMSAEVMIKTGARTPLEYLMLPIMRNLNKALRES